MEFLPILVCWYIVPPPHEKKCYANVWKLFYDRRTNVFVLYVQCFFFTRTILTRSSLQGGGGGGIKFLSKLRALLRIYLSNNGALKENIIPIQMSTSDVLLLGMI